MDELKILAILTIGKVILFGLISIAACLYAIPICFIRQFHKPLHLLTLNVCIAAFVCCTFWAICYTVDVFYPYLFGTPQLCVLISYAQLMVVCQVLYAFCMVSLNRLFAIVYKNKRLFHTKRWAAICASAQWILVALICSPIIASNSNTCLRGYFEMGYAVYLCIIAIVLPAICLIITNIIIFTHVRRSTRRVQPMNGDSAQAVTLSNRDARLLKHMIFMFAVFFSGWSPAFLVKTINANGDLLSLLTVQAILVMPEVSLLIDVVDLFLYNHELRNYFTNKRQMDQGSRPT